MAPIPGFQNKAGSLSRLMGIFVLVAGLAAAGLVYGLQKAPEDLSGDLATPATDKRQAGAVQVYVGRMGLLVDNLMADFQDPASLAMMIAGASVVVAGGFFYVGRLQARAFASDAEVSK
jgi:hypothetical protein